MKRLITIFYCLFQLQYASAQNAYMLKDIFPGTQNSLSSFLPFTYQRILIRAYSPIYGNEIWISNGTVNGTTLLKDINPGSASADPEDFFRFNNDMYFLANDGVNGKELWKTDGTAAGTVMVKDLEPGTGSSYNADFFKFNNGLYFVAYTPAYGDEIWKTDGTAAGTSLVKDICPGTCSACSSGTYFRHGWEINGNFYFVANDGVSGYELWKSNGTAAGTNMVKDIRTGIQGSSIKDFIICNNILYFIANDGVTGSELWKSDGTVAGTVFIKDINPGINDGVGTYSLPYYAALNGKLIFIGADHDFNSEPWRSDGTAAGTYMLKDIRPGTSGSGSWQFTNYNNALYFSANDSVHGREFWKTDGTVPGTTMVKDINPGGAGSDCDGGFVILNNLLIFFADNGTIGWEPWRSDGTANGTVALKDIYAGSYGCSAYNLKIVNNTLFLNATTNTYGRELWKTNGTSSGTVLVKDILPGSLNGCCLYSDMSEKGGPSLFFGGTDWTVFNYELWKSDGTAAGTVKVQEIYPGSDGCSLQSLVSVGNYLFFVANDSVHGTEPWAFKHSNVAYPLPQQLRNAEEQEENSLLTEITVSSNPSGGLFLLEINTNTKKEIDFQIFDCTGKEILFKKIISDTHLTEQIDLTRHADGIYFLKTTSDDGLRTFKLLKM